MHSSMQAIEEYFMGTVMILASDLDLVIIAANKIIMIHCHGS